MSSEAERYVERQRKLLTDGLHTCMYVEVDKIDLKFMRVDVKLPLPGEPIVMQVPIGTHQTEQYFIRPPYKEGDTVLLIFAEHDIDPILFEGGGKSSRKHSLDDAIVIGGVTPFTQPLPDDFEEHEEDWVFASRDYKTRIIANKDGDIVIDVDPERRIYLGHRPEDELPEEGIPLGKQLKEWLDNHTHSPTGSKPTTPSPDPSEKVLVQ